MGKLKKGVILFVILVMIFLAACSGTNSHDEDNTGIDGQEPKKVEVVLELPERAEPGETVNLVAHLTQGGEVVDDADEVVFEIWEIEDESRDNSKMIEVSEQKDGTYKSEYVFELDGVYYVQVHVTARNMHVMPKKKILIGDVEDIEVHDEHNDDENHEDHNH